LLIEKFFPFPEYFTLRKGFSQGKNEEKLLLKNQPVIIFEKQG
jgi:hypothetical protein